MKKKGEQFSIEYVQVLDGSKVIDKKKMPHIPATKLLQMYELMIRTRVFDDKAITLQRQGRLGTYASVHGQEACQIPSAIQMNEGDLAFPAFREHGVFLTRKTPPEKLLQYWGGDEQGMYLPEVNVFPVAITVGGHLPHAVGTGLGFKMQKKKNVALVYFGDGATSEGDFHEAMNFAGALNAPTIFICQNNQYAISTPVTEQTASKTLAQKAIAYGFEGVRVDGNDVFAVYSVVEAAIAKARAGKGPTFIECVTYRMGDHTTSDDAKRYRSDSERKVWEKKDPIARFETYLLNQKLITPAIVKSIRESAEQRVATAVSAFEALQLSPLEDIFKYTFAEIPEELVRQRDQLQGELS